MGDTVNRKELINRINNVMKNNGVRKPISIPKQVFHISDDEGNSKDFVVKKVDKTVMYTDTDIGAVLDAYIEVVEDALRHGEKVNIQGLGNFELRYVDKRVTKHPATGELVDVRGRYIPKFVCGTNLKKAAIVYGMIKDEVLKHDVEV